VKRGCWCGRGSGCGVYEYLALGARGVSARNSRGGGGASSLSTEGQGSTVERESVLLFLFTEYNKWNDA
jgi:hypothetical protein